MANVEPLLRKMVLMAATVLGIGFILVSISITVLLGYSLSQFQISSQQVVNAISGRLLFILASTALMVIGLLFVVGAIRFYERSQLKGVVFLGALLTCFYLLCLSVGSALLLQETTSATLQMLVAPILVVISAALYMTPSLRLKISGAALGVLGGVLLARVICSVRIFDLAFGWDLPFTGPFMSMVALEGIMVVLIPVAALVHPLFSNPEGKPLTHAFLLLIGLVYGIGLFVGSLILSLSFWNWIWKSPWYGPFYGLPSWVLSTIVFWSASLFLITAGGVLLIFSSCVGFVHVTQEFS